MAKLASLFDWLDHRTGYRGVLHEALYERIPGGARWRYVWGSTLVFTFAVQTITGIFLWMAYSPSDQTAWESVYYIQNEMHGGWLLRGLHHFTAQAMIVLLVLHLMQVIIDGAYRAPREFNFWIGLILMMIVLGLSLTGYLLPWDQKGYWATRVATNLMSLVDPRLTQLVVGGPDYGHHTLTRFFAMHAGVLPGLLVFFLVIHVLLFRRHGICAKLPVKRADATFWPDQVLKDAVACLAVLAVVLFLIVRPALFHSSGPVHPADLGAELGAPADSANAYSAARPEWYFLFLFQFLKLFEGLGARGEFFGAIIVPGLVMGLMFLMPLIGRWKLGHRFNIAFVLLLLAGIGWLTASAYIEDHRAQWTDPGQFATFEDQLRSFGGDEKKLVDSFGGDEKKIADFRRQKAAFERFKKSEDYLHAVAEAKEQAERVKELAAGPNRIPPAGALSMLRSDAKTQGRMLFEARCASCHTYFDPDGPLTDAAKQEILAHASAPNLFGFANRRWIAGLLDAKQIAGPQYFGNTAHKESEMVQFVTDDLPDASQWQPSEVKQVIAALSAEATLPEQRGLDRDEQAAIKAGQSLIKDANRCASCHPFRGAETKLGKAPDLTDYGSREWLIGFISNPRHERFYGKSNDRMPAFAPNIDPAQNKLTAKEIGMLADWLRGEWYRAEQ
jgi:quinol-cytochrome oxidoreductase complex cytochrome b subunit/mono/diheme cytochrome c family protein